MSAPVEEARRAADVGDFSKARAALARALDAASGSADLHALMAWYTCRCAELPTTERERLTQHHLDVALEMDPRSPDAHYYQGRVQALRGNAGRARASFEQALRLRADFQPAREALTALDTRTPGPEARPRRGRHAAPARVRLGIVVPCVALVIAAGGLSLLDRDPRAGDLRQTLGTRLDLVSVSEVGKDLYLDVGQSWHDFGTEERASEAQTIAAAAQGLGLGTVYVFSGGREVAEMRGGAACIEAKCLSVVHPDELPAAPVAAGGAR